jgi:hypothetical protein
MKGIVKASGQALMAPPASGFHTPAPGLGGGFHRGFRARR